MVNAVCVKLMQFFEDQVTDGDDDDRVVHGRSTHSSHKSRSASATCLNWFL